MAISGLGSRVGLIKRVKICYNTETFKLPINLASDVYCCLAAGGAGGGAGNNFGGGGGCGMVAVWKLALPAEASLLITVGTGGASGAAGTPTTVKWDGVNQIASAYGGGTGSSNTNSGGGGGQAGMAFTVGSDASAGTGGNGNGLSIFPPIFPLVGQIIFPVRGNAGGIATGYFPGAVSVIEAAVFQGGGVMTGGAGSAGAGTAGGSWLFGGGGGGSGSSTTVAAAGGAPTATAAFLDSLNRLFNYQIPFGVYAAGAAGTGANSVGGGGGASILGAGGAGGAASTAGTPGGGFAAGGGGGGSAPGGVGAPGVAAFSWYETA